MKWISHPSFPQLPHQSIAWELAPTHTPSFRGVHWDEIYIFWIYWVLPSPKGPEVANLKTIEVIN